MAGPRYTIPQTRARVAALQLCILYLHEQEHADEIEAKQFADIIRKFHQEIAALKEKAQRTRVYNEKRRQYP